MSQSRNNEEDERERPNQSHSVSTHDCLPPANPHDKDAQNEDAKKNKQSRESQVHQKRTSKQPEHRKRQNCRQPTSD